MTNWNDAVDPSPGVGRGHERDLARWRTADLVVAVAVSLAIGVGCGAVTLPARGVLAGDTSPDRPPDVERPVATPRQELIVAAVAAAGRDGCSVILKTGQAPLRAEFGFRRATRTLAHEFMSRRMLERVASTVIRTERGLAGVVYGERCE
jgi:hypothetical protein